MRLPRRLVRAAVACAAAVFPLIAAADPVADFYRGKQVFLIQSGGQGGGYYAYAQAFAPYLAKHIPGNPHVLVQSMPGAGGLRLMQYLATTAPRDGTDLGFVQSGAPFVPLMGTASGTFDPRKMNWLGAMSHVPAVCGAWYTSGISTFQDLLKKPFVVGSSGAGSLTEVQPELLNRFYGTKIKIIPGYPGANDMYLAMERGELQGRCGGSVDSWRVARPEWVRDGKVKFPIQFSIERGRDLPDVPTAYELANNDRVRAVMKLALAPVEMNRPMLTAPGVPADRVAALRAAFHSAINDPDFVAEAAKQRLELEEVPGAKVARIVDEAYATPPDIIELAKEAITPAH